MGAMDTDPDTVVEGMEDTAGEDMGAMDTMVRGKLILAGATEAMEDTVQDTAMEDMEDTAEEDMEDTIKN